MNPPVSTLSRRELLLQLSLLSAASGLGATSSRAADAASKDHLHGPQPQLRMGSEKIAILVYPEFTALDAMGPHYPLAGMMGASVQFVAKTLDVVPAEGASRGGFCVKPQLTFESCPADLDLLLVPGGIKGTLAAMQDKATLDFLADRGAKAKRVGSVCTGSLVLGAAGLLKRRRATSHWQTLSLLRDVGATPVAERFVFDGDTLVTAAGVSAGLDLGFELVRRYRGDFYAKGVQLLGEYDPQPPFPGGGNPRTADPLTVKMLDEMHVPLVDMFRQALEVAKAVSGKR